MLVVSTLKSFACFLFLSDSANVSNSESGGLCSNAHSQSKEKGSGVLSSTDCDAYHKLKRLWLSDNHVGAGRSLRLYFLWLLAQR